MAEQVKNPIISQIQLPNNGGTYDIYDASAIHDVNDLQLASVLTFRGTKATKAELDKLTGTTNRAGDVWYVTEDDCEYVWIVENKDTGAGRWEALGNIHDAAASNHIHGVIVTGTNSSSAVTGTATVPSIEATTRKIALTKSDRGTPSTDKALGTGATFTTTGGVVTQYAKATASGASVSGQDQTVVSSIDTTADKTVLGAGTTFAVTGGAATQKKLVTTSVKTVTNVTESNAMKVTNNGEIKTAGVAATWGASVTDGVLSFSWTTNTPTEVTLPTFAKSDATVVGTTPTTVATGAITNSDVTTNVGAAVTVGISQIGVTANADDAVKPIMTVTPTSATAIKQGTLSTTQPTIALALDSKSATGRIGVATGIQNLATVVATTDEVEAITSIGESTYTLTDNATDGITVSNVSIGTQVVNVSGTAEAQTWSQVSGTTGQPQ